MGGRHNSQCPRTPGTGGSWREGPHQECGPLGEHLLFSGWPHLPSGLWGAAGLRLTLSLQRGQQAQEQALALLRQRAELEVCETRRALDGLLSKHRLEVPAVPLPLPGHHPHPARPGQPAHLSLRACGPPKGHAASSLSGGRLPLRKGKWGAADRLLPGMWARLRPRDGRLPAGGLSAGDAWTLHPQQRQEGFPLVSWGLQAGATA